VLPLEITINPSKVHLLHGLFATFFVEQGHILFVLGKNQQPTRTFVQPVQHIDIFEPILVFKQIFDGVVVMSSPGMHDDAWRFIDNQKLLTFVDNIDGQIQHGRLNPQGDMGNLVAIFENVVDGHLLVIDCNFGVIDGVFVILRRVGFELFDEGGQEFLPDPSAFGKGLVGVGIGSDESERKSMDILRSLLVGFVLLHL